MFKKWALLAHLRHKRIFFVLHVSFNICLVFATLLPTGFQIHANFSFSHKSMLWAVVGQFSAVLLLSVPHHCLQFGLKPIWPGKSRHCLGRGGGCSSVCMRMIDISQTLHVALIGCIELGAVDSCKSNYSHWVEPQTVDFYTADLYLILLSDHNDNFRKYITKK